MSIFKLWQFSLIHAVLYVIFHSLIMIELQHVHTYSY